MKILVTGGAGFIGSHLAAALLSRGHEVVILDDLSGGFVDNVPAGAEFVKGSILDHKFLLTLFEEEKFEVVYHLAAYAAEGLSHFIRRFNYNDNLIGSVNLINLAVEYEIKRFVFTSSIAVYGKAQVPMTEEMTPLPEDPYGIAKYAVELDLSCASEMFGLNYTVFRPHNVYGEMQNIGDRYRNVIGIFMRQIMADTPITIFGDGTQTRSFTYIGDVIPVMVDCLHMPETAGETFNVGADKPYTVNDLAEAVIMCMGKRVPVRHLEARREVKFAFSDHSKLRRYFPNLPEPVSLKEGLERMARWAKAAGSRKTLLSMEVELLQGMPSFWLEELADK